VLFIQGSVVEPALCLKAPSCSVHLSKPQQIGGGVIPLFVMSLTVGGNRCVHPLREKKHHLPFNVPPIFYQESSVERQFKEIRKSPGFIVQRAYREDKKEGSDFCHFLNCLHRCLSKEKKLGGNSARCPKELRYISPPIRNEREDWSRNNNKNVSFLAEVWGGGRKFS